MAQGRTAEHLGDYPEFREIPAGEETADPSEAKAMTMASTMVEIRLLPW
jgi:hypothetical protein